MVGIGIIFAILGTYLVLVAAFCPGAAMLHFARNARWSPVPTAIALVLIAAPAAAVALSPDPGLQAVANLTAVLIYALWFFPGLIVLLNKWSENGPNLGPIASLVYISPFLLLSASLVFGTGSPIESLGWTGIIAVLAILLLRTPKLLRAARVLGIALFLVPLVVPAMLRLPAHLAMARACDTEAGSAVSGRPDRISRLALDLGTSGCKGPCRTLIGKRQVDEIETQGDGTEAGAGSHASGLYRYALEPLRSSQTPAARAADENGRCAFKVWFKEGKRCVVATPIDGYSADYLLRNRGDEMPGHQIRQRAYEIVDRRNGDVVAWTVAYFMPKSSLESFYDFPLQSVLPLRGRCETNGPMLDAFLDDFLPVPE